MGWLYSPIFLAVMGVLVLDVAAGMALIGLARAQARLGRWEKSDRAYALRLAAPLPGTRLLLDGLHGQRPYLQHERLATMRLFGRFDRAAVYGASLADAGRTPEWLRVVAAALVAESLAEAGHLESALGRLDALLDDVPEEVPGLRGAIESSRAPLLMALGRWEEAERSVAEIERFLPALGREWPAYRLALSLARDEEGSALQLVRPLLEGDPAWPDPSDAELRQTHGAAALGPLLAARAAQEAGWQALRDRLVARLREVDVLPPTAAPLLSALEAVGAADRGDGVGAAEADERAREELDRLGAPSGPLLETGRLLVAAQSRLGHHEVACDRAAGLVAAARSPLARWRAHRAHGEALEAAGRSEEAVEAYRAALATGIETRLGPELERRLSELAPR